MKEFTQSMPFIIFFMVLTVLLQTFTNTEVTNGFLTLILFSMVILNADKFKKLIDGVSK
ncbi:hypothetical protein ABE244_25615 [Bacillus toyonensis]|uniref:hypothetical protein n=1 Tax=Bacillus toyonensis TaxID=155322 RepID=UPI003D1EDFB3